MKQNLSLILLLAFASATNAQQLQTSSMYDLQGTLHNPSMAGVLKNNILGASYRSQWSGLSGSPKTVTIFGSFKMPKHKIGVGGFLFNDKTGPTSRTGIELSLAKHIVGDKGTFSLGIATRLQQYSLDRAKLTSTLGADPALGNNDSRFKYDAGFGISYTTDKYQVGVSAAQLVQSKLNFYTGNLTPSEEAKLHRHYYLHALYNWTLDDENVLTPNALLIYLPNAPSTFLVGAKLEHKKMFWFGGGYRYDQGWLLTAGVHVKKDITIGYAYDDYISPISQLFKGTNSHEILLRYNIMK